MASFTDKVPQFNPYVSQQPVEAMVKVGMMKQQQYDTNVQKIKQTMSNISGLPVGRDVDKEYLNTKMQEMSDRLRPYAAGDFSNNQLTSTVRGMIGGIANDEVVQNAVRSSMAAASAKSLQSKYTSEGKGSPSNDWLLGTQLQKWYNDPNPGATFNSTYKPYTDYKKNTVDIIKELTGDESVTENAFDFDSNGNLVIHDAITKKKLESLTPEKIQTALMAGLSPADWEQISVDGRYQYSNIQNPERFKQVLDGRHNAKIQRLEGAKAQMEEAKSITNNIEDINYYDAQIEAIDNNIAMSKKNHNEAMGNLNINNLESYKAQHFTENYMNNISNAFSYKKQEISYKANPFAERAWARERARVADLKWQNDFNWDKEKFWANYEQKERLDGTKPGDAPFTTGAPGEFTIPTEFLPDANMVTLDRMILDFDRDKQNLIAQSGLSEGEFMNKYNEFLDNNKSISDMDPKYHRVLFAYDDIERKELLYNETKSDIIAQAEEQFPTIDDFVSAEDKVKRYPYRNDETGEEALVTNEDILYYNQQKEDYRKRYGYNQISPKTGVNVSSRPLDRERAKRELSPEMYHLLVADNLSSAYMMPGYHADLKNTLKHYQKDYFKSNEYKSSQRDKKAFINEEIGKRLPVGNAVEYALQFDSPDKRKEYFTRFATSINNQLSTIGGLAGGEGINKAEFEDFISQSGSLVPSIKYGFYGGKGLIADRQYYALMTNAAGEMMRVPLPETIVTEYGVSQFEETSSENFEDNVIETVMMKNGRGYGSTGNEQSTFNSAYYNNIYFPRVKVYNIAADIYRFPQGDYSVRLNLVDPVTGKVRQDLAYPRRGTVSGGDLQMVFDSLNDDLIFQLMENRKAGQIIKDKEALEKALVEKLAE